MDVNSVMGAYNMNSLWNNINQNGSSTVSTFPLINNLDSTVNETYNSNNFFGQTTNTQLQDIYQQIEPSYNIPVTYNQNGSFNVSPNTTSPNIMSLLNSNNSTSDSLTESLLSQYSTTESGAAQSYYSSILSSNPTTLYNSISSLGAMASSAQSPSVLNTVA
jgi:hypothetical protein